MDESIIGSVSIGGKQLKKGTFFTYGARNIQFFGFPVRGVLTEYDKTYTAWVEGFVDVDGIMMDPQEITIRTLPMNMPQMC